MPSTTNFQDFPPLGTPDPRASNKRKKSKKVSRKLDLPVPVNQITLIGSEQADELAEIAYGDLSTDSGAEVDTPEAPKTPDEGEMDKNIALLPEALKQAREGYEACFNTCKGDQTEIEKYQTRSLTMDEMVTKTPTTTVWRITGEKELVLEGNA